MAQCPLFNALSLSFSNSLRSYEQELARESKSIRAYVTLLARDAALPLLLAKALVSPEDPTDSREAIEVN